MVDDEPYWVQYHIGLATQSDDEIFDYLQKSPNSRMQLALAKRFKFEIDGDRKILLISTR